MAITSKLKWGVPVCLTIAGWFVAPYIKAKMEGTPLNGLPGILAFLEHLFTFRVPVWLPILVVVVVVFLSLLLLKRRPSSKPNLSIVVLTRPKPNWHIGAEGTVPILSLRFEARLATTDEHSVEIVNAYLEGTEAVILFCGRIVVSGRHDASTQVYFGVRPILVKPGETLKRRVILIDQYGNKHLSDKIAFSDIKHPPEIFGIGSNTVNCHICGKIVSAEDFHPSAAFAAHRNCIK